MSGRGKQAVPRPAADQLAALAGRLSDRDRQLCHLLHDHQILTTDQLAHLLTTPPRTLQQRLAELTALQVVDRFRPHTGVGGGSAPYHYLLGEAGARILATDAGTTVEGLGWRREQLLTLANSNGALGHLLGVNGLLAALTHTTHTRAGSRLVCWWPARRCQARWGRLICPDAYVRWQDPSGEVDFFLHHHHPDHPKLEQLVGLLAGYNDLATATRITTPVLWWLTDADREAGLRRQLASQELLVPVATANPTCGHPADPVWLPTSSPAGAQRYRLGALGRAEPWQPTSHATVVSPAPRPHTRATAAASLEGPWSIEVGPHTRAARHPSPPPPAEGPDVAKRLIRPTQEFTTELPFSEACMHLRVAGTRMRARLEPNQMVQLLHPDGSRFSFPITAAEAGLDTDGHGAWLTTVDHHPDSPAPDPAAATQPNDLQHPRLLHALSQPLDVPDRQTWRGQEIEGPAGPLYWHPKLGYVSVPDPDDQP